MDAMGISTATRIIFANVSKVSLSCRIQPIGKRRLLAENVNHDGLL